jgi:hypothetical protein
LKDTFFDYKIIRLPELEEFSFLLKGENKKNILILYQDDMWEDSLDYLQKILKATGLDLNEDTIFYNPKSADALPTLNQIADKHPIHKIILFGIHPKQVGIHADIKAYTISPFYGFQFLVAERLSAIKSSKEHREALWNELKTFFSQ